MMTRGRYDGRYDGRYVGDTMTRGSTIDCQPHQRSIVTPTNDRVPAPPTIDCEITNDRLSGPYLAAYPLSRRTVNPDNGPGRSPSPNHKP